MPTELKPPPHSQRRRPKDKDNWDRFVLIATILMVALIAIWYGR
jgi:hypothetical protein